MKATSGARVVFVQTAFLGDVLLSIPLFVRARRIWPNEEFVLVCRAGLGALFKNLRLVDEVLEVKKSDSTSYELALLEIKKVKVKAVICPHGSLRSAIFSRKIDTSCRVSFSKSWNFLHFTHRLPFLKKYPESVRQLMLLTPFDENLKKMIAEINSPESLIEYGTSDTQLPETLCPPLSWASMKVEASAEFMAERAAVVNRLKLTPHQLERAVFIFPGSAWATKCWRPEGFAEVCVKLRAAGFQPVLMGAPNESNLCKTIETMAQGSLNLSGQTTISESFLLLSLGQAVLANDSASAHLASCLDLPIVTIFGPTVLEFGFRPWSSKVRVIEQKGLSCRPCGKHGHKKCPIGTHDCMKQISSHLVFESLTKDL